MSGTARTARSGSGAASMPEFADALRALLDHVAEELAAEYVRLLREREETEDGHRAGGKGR